MCLVIDKNQETRVAEQDITVYKVMIKKSETKWITPYFKKEVDNPTAGTVIRTVEEIQRNPVIYWYQHEVTYYDGIEGGMIHGFSSLDNAIKAARKRPDWVLDSDCVAVWELIIPKGTEYIVGHFNEIAAKEIRFVKQINF